MITPPRPPEGKQFADVNEAKGWLGHDDVLKRINLHAKLVAALKNVRGLVDLIAGTYGEQTVKRSAKRQLIEIEALLKEAAK